MQVLFNCLRLFVVAKLLSPERLSGALKEVLDDYTELSKAKAIKGIRRAAIKTLSGIVKMSPIGNSDRWKTPYKPKGYVGGRFRNNWFIGSVVTGETTTETDKKGTGYIGKYVNTQTFKTPVFFYNNLPYAYALEFGHSKQTPKGMVRINVLKWKKNLKNAFEAVK